MAHHSLHHLVELEQLFDQAAHWLHPEGAFVAMDMIGRNGHMRWPETLAVIRRIWPHLPDRLKWDRMFWRLDRWYENWDCSIEGFEGIRAQDILPALLRGPFRFSHFVATGGLSDVFYDRRFGGNFQLDNALDTAFLEQLQALEDRLTATGQIKPVCLYAVLRSARSTTAPRAPVCCHDLTPERALRPVAGAAAGPPPIAPDSGFRSPYPAAVPPPATPVARGTPVSFARGGGGQTLTRWGWSEPEDALTWSLGIASALEFTVVDSVQVLDLRFVAYQPPDGENGSLNFMLNGMEQERIELAGLAADGHRLRLRQPLAAGARAVLEFGLSRPRRPDLDGGGDKRPLGIALIAMTAA